MDNQDDDALDVLHGVAAIAAYIKLPKHKTNYEISKGYWPVFRRGKLISARKSELRAAASGRAQGSPK
jgi:hypothetical protein